MNSCARRFSRCSVSCSSFLFSISFPPDSYTSLRFFISFFPSVYSERWALDRCVRTNKRPLTQRFADIASVAAAYSFREPQPLTTTTTTIADGGGASVVLNRWCQQPLSPICPRFLSDISDGARLGGDEVRVVNLQLDGTATSYRNGKSNAIRQQEPNAALLKRPRSMGIYIRSSVACFWT